jgi:peptidyl-prolyl cis-trans isomerase SurA
VKIFNVTNLIIVVLVSARLGAQPFVADKIVGVVGKNQILYSEIEDQYLQMQAQDEKHLLSKCQIFEDILAQKLLVNQAAIDSIEVDESEVDAELEQRINYFINQIGTEAKLVEYFGKSILEIKQDMRDAVRDQILMQRMRQEIISNSTITPSDVKDFFNNMPPDSIPFIDAEVEINQIVIYPATSEEAVLEVREKLLDLRQRILNGENFATLAVLYSEDNSASRGGDIGWASKSELDPVYAKAAFALQKKQVSKIVESAYGCHIIQLIDRTEDRVQTRHILLKPKISIEEKEKAKARLDSILRLIRIDTLTFEKAAIYFSQDEDTKLNGGLRINPANGNTHFELNQFATSEYYIIRDLQVGEISNPFESTDDKGKLVYKTIRLKSKTEPHKANLKQDFELIKQMAMEKKQNEIVDNWLKEKIKNTFIRINEPYKDCDFRLKGWSKNQ